MFTKHSQTMTEPQVPRLWQVPTKQDAVVYKGFAVKKEKPP